MVHARSDSAPPVLFSLAVSGRDSGEVLSLPEDELRHVRALRLQAGDEVRLTDGAGALWKARLAGPAGRGFDCVLEERLEAAAPLPVRLVFAVGQKAHVLWLVEKATELGVVRLSPLDTTRSRSVADAGRSPAFWTKARRRAISARKQSGGAWLPILDGPQGVADYLRTDEPDPARLGPRVRLDYSGSPLKGVVEGWDGVREMSMIVGPEGGWSESEVLAFDEAGYARASLGPLVLRFETAAVAGLAVALQQIMSRSGHGERA